MAGLPVVKNDIKCWLNNNLGGLVWTAVSLVESSTVVYSVEKKEKKQTSVSNVIGRQSKCGPCHRRSSTSFLFGFPFFFFAFSFLISASRRRLATSRAVDTCFAEGFQFRRLFFSFLFFSFFLDFIFGKIDAFTFFRFGTWWRRRRRRGGGVLRCFFFCLKTKKKEIYFIFF